MTQSSSNDVAAAEPSFNAAPNTGEQKLDIRFTGSGSEYFRIWIVNLLLTILTLSLYHPWAKVRRLRYFYGNTLVDGHALDFHGNPWKMLRGYLLVGAMAIAYSVATRLSPIAGFVAFGIMAAIWPALFKASMQFKLANTSWRGLRFRFRGKVGGAYKALLPLFVPTLIFLAITLGVKNPKSLESQEAVGLGVLAVMLPTLLLIPLLLWNLKKYQHDNYSLGQLQTELKASRGSFYAVFLKTTGVSILSGVVFAIIFGFVMAFGLFSGFVGKNPNAPPGLAAVVAGLVFAVIGMVAVQLLPRPYFESRFQNLLWGKTGSDHLHFKSELRFSPLLWLTIKNWFLMIITVGLYWPFAKVAMARLRLDAVTIATTLHINQLHDQLRVADGDATGDAAGDFFGIDIGL